MSNATIYCSAPARAVQAVVGARTEHLEVEAENDGRTEYQSLVAVWASTRRGVQELAESTARRLADQGISGAVWLDGDPVPFTGRAAV